MKIFQILMLITIACTFFACTSSPSNIDDSSGSLLPGYFAGVAGEEQSSQHYEEFNGSAIYSLSAEDTTFNIVLTSIISPGDTSRVILRTKSFETPGEESFTLRNVDSIKQIYFTGFSLFYHSALIESSEVYFSESGTLILEDISDIGMRGNLVSTTFRKAYTGKDEYVRLYTTINLDFYAIPEM